VTPSAPTASLRHHATSDRPDRPTRPHDRHDPTRNGTTQLATPDGSRHVPWTERTRQRRRRANRTADSAREALAMEVAADRRHRRRVWRQTATLRQHRIYAIRGSSISAPPTSNRGDTALRSTMPTRRRPPRIPRQAADDLKEEVKKAVPGHPRPDQRKIGFAWQRNTQGWTGMLKDDIFAPGGPDYGAGGGTTGARYG